MSINLLAILPEILILLVGLLVLILDHGVTWLLLAGDRVGSPVDG